MRQGTRVAACLLLATAAASVAFAQRIWTGGGRFYREPPKWAKEADFDGSFLYCRGFYNAVTVRPAAGMEHRLPRRRQQFLGPPGGADAGPRQAQRGPQPNYGVVSLTDPLLYNCPILFMEDVGTLEFSDAEVLALRAYFLKGGFLWVDDYWGSFAWDRWSQQIGAGPAAGQFPIFDVPLTHPDHAHAV